MEYLADKICEFCNERKRSLFEVGFSVGSFRSSSGEGFRT